MSYGLSLEAVLDKISFFRELLGPERREGEESKFFCPNNCHLEKPKLAVNFEKNKYHCWKCGYGSNNLRNFIKFFFHGRLSEWDRLFPDSLVPKEEKLAQEGEDKPEWIFYDMGKWQKKLHSCVNNTESLSLLARDYLFARKKISRMSLLMWDVRVSYDGKSIFVPSYNNDGKVNLYVKKVFYDDGNVFTEVPQISKKNVIFNEFFIDWSRPLYIVENVFDAMRFDFGESVPILGSDIRMDSKLVDTAIKYGTRICLFLDSDDTGIRKSYKIYDKLSKLGVNVTICDNVFGDFDSMEDWQINVAKNTFLSYEKILKSYITYTLE